MSNCTKCGFDHFDFQDCLEIFYYKDEEEYCGWHKIGACHHEDAAERASIKHNSDHAYVNDFVFKKIEIANHDKSIIKSFSVYAEPEIHYSVSEV